MKGGREPIDNIRVAVVHARGMTASFPALLATGFLLGWSVAWPPGPINAEIARRCGSGEFWAGIAVLVGASSADALWAVAVARSESGFRSFTVVSNSGI